jgi:gluconolactonase
MFRIGGLVPVVGVASLFVPVAGCGGGGSSEPTTAERTTPPSLATADPVVGHGQVELIKEGYQFTEGPQWIADEGVLLFTDAAGVIYQVAANDEISEFRVPSNGANGLAVDPKGRLLAAENKTRRVTRTESDGTVIPIAEQFEGIRLNQPNDIAVRSDGTIYFTDPYYGDGTTELDFHGVFRIAPDGSLTAEYRGAVTEQPNGVALSPEESRLYVANWSGNVVWMFEVSDDGSLSEAQPFVTTGDGPDGMAIDNAGNLFVATAQGIEAYAPDGARWGIIEVPRTPANASFGGADGRTLYITAGEGLYRVTLTNPGPY